MKNQEIEVVTMAVGALRIHPRAQRDFVCGNTYKEIVNSYDPGKIGVLHAVRYPVNGERATWVVDGQTRTRGMLARGLSDHEVLVAVHLYVKNDAQASELFLSLNDRSTVAPFEKFKNEVQALRIDAVGVVRILDKYGLVASKSAGDGRVCCVTALKKIWNIDAGRALDTTIRIITSAWGKKANALEGKLIEGIGIVCAAYSTTLDSAALIKKLAKYPGGASGVIGRAGMVIGPSSVSKCVSAVVVDLYNSGRRNGRLEAL
jgi:hypothetical protein